MNGRRLRSPAAIAGLWLISGSGCTSDPRSQLLAEVFAAVAARDEAAFLRRTITLADVDLREQGVSAFQAGQTYLGGVIRPEQVAELRRQFQRAIAAGPGRIDFARDELLGCGTVLQEGSQETLCGSRIRYLVCSLRIARDGKETDAKDLYPHLVLTEWDGGDRLLALVFPPD